ncbi:MAG: sigma-70 family RNA polymerase sigma factor [Sphingobacteriales bacterium]|nr:sigma-70 family RNA polymerase sigma factor [Sphingobacteriales bacterium]
MNSLSTLTDPELILLYQQKGDTACIGELYKRYSLLVYGLCYKYLKEEEEAKDAVTDIFEIVLEKLKIHQVGFFKSWLFMVSKHHLIRQQSKNNSLEIIDIENISEKIMESATDLSLNKQEHESELLQEAISNLNDEQRTCIDLFYLQQKPYQEVASITGYDLNKVKSAIQNGKRNLKLFMEEKKQQHG